jgi:uncharacterized protein YjdB
MRPIIRTVTASLLIMSAVVVACTGDTVGPRNGLDPSLRLVVSPKSDTIAIGTSAQLVAQVLGQQNAVAWRSDNLSVASVSGTGSVTGLAVGVAHVIAQAGDATDTATVVVQSTTTLSISPGAALVMLGDSLQLAARSTAGGAGSVEWVTSDPTIATVGPNGVMNTLAEGSVTINASISGVTASASVNVSRASVASMTVAPQNASIIPGGNVQLVATPLDASGRTLSGVVPKWSSSNTAIAQVSATGVVTGVAKGLAVITAQTKSVKATASINVLAVPAASVAVALASSSLSSGQTTQATATVKDASGNVLTGRVIAWQSSNPALATVNSNGLVTAVANGSVTISAIVDGQVGNAPLTVSAPVPTSIAIIPGSLSLTLGQSTQVAAEVRDAKGVAIPNQAITWSSKNAAIAPISSTGMINGTTVGQTMVQASSDGLTDDAQVSVTSVPAASVTVSPTSLTLAVGDTARLSATVRDASNAILTDRAVTWSSSNPGVATVGVTGLVTAVTAGSANISAVVDGITTTATVTVTPPAPPPVASVSATLASASLTVGQTTQATAVLKDAAGNVLTGRTITWSSANTDVATISSTGVVTAVSAGSASILATSEGQSGGAPLTVVAPPPAPVATVTLSASSSSLLVGATLQVTATLKDAAGNVLTGRTIGWTSSNTSVASVSPTGLVTGVTAGNVTLTATSETKTGTLTLTVAAVPVNSVAVGLASSSLQVGQSTQATVTLRDASGNVLSGRSVTWSSSSPSVGSVSATGVVTAVAAGATNIVATSEGKSGSATLTVTAVATTPPPPPPSGGSCNLVTGTSTVATSALAKPGYLQSVIDPDFGTKITRITGDPGTPIGYGISGSWPTVAYHNYPKDPVFSADQKLLVLKHMSGVVGPGGALFLDGTTYQPLFSRTGPSGGGEWRWHPSLPDIMVYLNLNGTVGHWNVRTNVSTVKVAAVSGYTSNELGPSEGNVSYDGRWMVAKAVRTSDNHIVGRVIDIDGGQLGPVVDLTAAGLVTLDWVSISAGGAYIVAEGDFGLGRSDTRKIYRASDGALISTWSDYLGQHVDLGIDAAGNEVMFSATSQSPYTHGWYARRLLDGVTSGRTPTGVTSYNWHVSNRMNGRPGWGVGSTNDNTGETFDGEIYMLALDGSQRVERLAHHRANQIDYDSYPFPTPSPDGKRVVFASNWMSSGRPIQTYVVDTRDICP